MINLVILIVLLELVLYLFNSQIPVPPWVKTVVNVLACLFVIVWLLQMAGFTGGFHLGRLR